MYALKKIIIMIIPFYSESADKSKDCEELDISSLEKI